MKNKKINDILMDYIILISTIVYKRQVWLLSASVLRGR